LLLPNLQPGPRPCAEVPAQRLRSATTRPAGRAQLSSPLGRAGGTLPNQRRTAASRRTLGPPAVNRLAQFLHYAQKVFALKTVLRAVRAARPFAQIPTTSV